MFGTKNVEIKPQVEYIRPGIQEVEVVSVSSDEDRNTVNFKLKVIGQEDDSATEFKMYLSSEKAIAFNTLRIKRMGKAATNDDSIDVVEASSLEEYGNKLNKFFAGKQLRMVFGGRQYVKQDGNIGVWSELGTGNFAEHLSVENTKLVFNEERMVSKVEVQEASSMEDSFGSKSDEATDNDLPFLS
jgi:hypothetical protein